MQLTMKKFHILIQVIFKNDLVKKSKPRKTDSETSISYECDILIWDHLRDYNRRSGAPSLVGLPLPTTSLAIKIDIVALSFKLS